jgi:hypothetical protein
LVPGGPVAGPIEEERPEAGPFACAGPVTEAATAATVIGTISIFLMLMGLLSQRGTEGPRVVEDGGPTPPNSFITLASR